MRRPTLISVLLATLAGAGFAQGPRFAPVHEMLPAELADVERFALGDLDGDGDRDALAVHGAADRVLLNDGLGVFHDVSATHWPGGDGSGRDAVLADFDGDGDLDAVIAELGGPLHAFANDGSGHFTDVTAAWLGSTPRYPSALASADVDADGDADLLVGHGARLQDRLYLNDGSGRLVDVTASHLPADVAVTFAVAFADVDADGDLDAALGWLYGPTRLYRNDGSGHFTDASAGNLPVDAGGTRALAFGDIDADGDADLLLGEVGDPVRCYVNDGSGRFTDATAARMPAEALSTFDLVLRDLDADGDLDLLVAEFSAGVRVLRNGGSGVFADLPGATPPELQLVAGDLAAGDLDGDGDADLLIADPSHSPQLWLGDSSARFVDATLPALPLPDDTLVSDGAFADVDADGDLDLVLAVGRPSDDRANMLLRQDDGGSFTDVSSTALPNDLGATLALAAGDLDGDGDVDLLFGNALGQQDQLLLGDGAGGFTDATTTHFPTRNDWTESVALADLDGDGDLDAFVARWNGPDDVLHNDGQGRLTSMAGALPGLPSADQDSFAVVLGDLDGDGDTDAVVAVHAAPNRVYRNGGGGVFTDVTAGSLSVAREPTQDVALADIEADGDLDVYFANQQIGDQLWLNDGSGTFAAAPAGAIPSYTGESHRVAFADLDADGDPDLVLATSQAGERVAFNDGTGRFTPALALPRDGTAERLLPVDSDADGDVDLTALGHRSTRHLPNHARHLAWRSLPCTGKPLRLVVEGPAHGFHLLNVGLRPARWPLPFGLLRLDPAGLVAGFGGVLDGDGRSVRSFAVPALPALVGFTLHWQALVSDGTSLRFTDLEPTTFRGA